MNREGSILKQKYKIIKHLSSGGMADIYLAKKQGCTDDLFVLKSISNKLINIDVDFKYFQREIQISSSLDHPNLVHFYETWQDDQRAYLVLEYIRGQNLKSILEQHKPIPLLPIQAILFLLVKISSGIAFLHSKKIIHRDISPSNIMISKKGQLKIIDFGISKQLTESNVTFFDGLKGKYKYLSPEQARKGPLGCGTDIFQLGLLFYELFFGSNLFEGKTERSILYFLDKLTLDVVLEKLVDTPAQIKDLLVSMLHPQIENRASAQEINSKLKNLLANSFPDYNERHFVEDLALDTLSIEETIPMNFDEENIEEQTLNLSSTNYTNDFYLSLVAQSSEAEGFNFFKGLVFLLLVGGLLVSSQL